MQKLYCKVGFKYSFVGSLERMKRDYITLLICKIVLYAYEEKNIIAKLPVVEFQVMLKTFIMYNQP